MKKRINYIDISRAFAIIFIVLGHTLVHSEHCSIIFKFLYSFHVVLFFIISGYTFRIKENYKYLSFLKNKFIRIMVPYFIWSLLFLIPYMLFGGDVANTFDINSTFDVKQLLFNILYGNGNLNALKQNSSLWFLPALFSMEAIYYFIVKINNKYKYGWHFSILIAIAIGYITNYLLNSNSIYLPWGINTVLNLGVFFLIGCIIKDDKINKFLYKWYINIWLFILGFLAFYFNKGVSCIDYIYNNYTLMLISGFCLSVLVINIAKLINHNVFLEYIGKNTMGILIFHKLIVLIFQTKASTISKYLTDSSLFIEACISIIVSLLTIIISLLISKIIRKICPICLGELKNKH